MEILSSFFLTTILLSLIGSVTVLALASMAVLGITTEMSFRRLFFVSFGIGLLAPILLAMGVSSLFDDESFKQQLLTELSEVVTGSENIVQALPRIRELRQQFSDGTITQDEFEDQLEQLIEETSGAQIELEGVEITPEIEAQVDQLIEGE